MPLFDELKILSHARNAMQSITDDIAQTYRCCRAIDKLIYHEPADAARNAEADITERY